MTILKQSAFTLAVTLFALLMSVQAQTPGIDINTDSHQVQFAAQGKAQEIRVEVFGPSGEIVFDSGAVTGQAVEWNMRNEKGESVADGVYLATIQFKSTSGQLRKRIEQIMVSHNKGAPALIAQPTATPGPITGTGTAGSIARFTGPTVIGNSVITQSVTKNIGFNMAPTAVLHVYGLQPAALANNGTAATTLLQTSGGKGGNTTLAGKTGGKGANISLLAGNGGNAVGGATNGSGGSITLQPGSAGTGARVVRRAMC